MSPWVGAIAPQSTGVALPPPVVTAQASSQAADQALITITSPAGITLGDLMMFTVIMIPRFVGFTGRTLDSGVTLLTDPTIGFGAVLIVGYRYADAGDVAATSSYTFSAPNSGGIGYSRATITSFPASYGTTTTTAQVDVDDLPSIAPTPGSDWYFVAALSGHPTAGGGTEPIFTLTSAGDLLLSSTGGFVQTSTKTFSSAKSVSPVTGTYANDHSYNAMSVIGINV